MLIESAGDQLSETARRLKMSEEGDSSNGQRNRIVLIGMYA